jgi:hypothetical protein
MPTSSTWGLIKSKRLIYIYIVEQKQNGGSSPSLVRFAVASPVATASASAASGSGTPYSPDTGFPAVNTHTDTGTGHAVLDANDRNNNKFGSTGVSTIIRPVATTSQKTTNPADSDGTGTGTDTNANTAAFPFRFPAVSSHQTSNSAKAEHVIDARRTTRETLQ